MKKPTVGLGQIALWAMFCAATATADQQELQRLGNCGFGADGQETVQLLAADSAKALRLELATGQGSHEIQFEASTELLGFPSPLEVSIKCAPAAFALRYEASFGNAYQMLIDHFERHPDGNFFYAARWLVQADRQGFGVYGIHWDEPRPLARYDPIRSAQRPLLRVFDTAMLDAFEQQGHLPPDAPNDLLREALAIGLLSSELSQPQQAALMRELERRRR